MQSNSSEKSFDFLSAIIAAVAIVFTISFLSKLFKDTSGKDDKDIVSDEGKKILSDPTKRKLLNEAIDHFHKEGNWEKLKALES